MATPASILHTIDTTGPGGAETVFIQLAQHLKVPGYRNVALITGPGWVEQQLKTRNVTYSILKPFGFGLLPYYWSLIKIIRRENIQLIQANLLGSALTFAIIGLITRTPVVATLHGRVDIHPGERFLWLKNALLRWGVNQLITVSKDLSGYICQRKLFEARKISVIYNGINPNSYCKIKTAHLKNTLQLPENAFLIGSVGNIRPAKDYPNLIAAAALVIKQYPNAYFIIAGHPKNPLQNQLLHQVLQLGLQKHIHFIGFHEDTADFLNQLDCFCLSSSTEGFSIATLEAMASAIPIVATRCGGPEEILSHEKTGILVPSANPEALANGILQILKNPDFSQQLIERARAHLLETFTDTIMFNAYTHHYRELLNR